MTGRELLAVARDLLERAEEAPAGCTASAMYRSAINRAYYGLFTACVATLNRVGFQVNNSSNAHAHVQQALNNSRQPDVVDASSRLRALSLDRRRGLRAGRCADRNPRARGARGHRGRRRTDTS
jgi:hypothetical protein